MTKTIDKTIKELKVNIVPIAVNVPNITPSTNANTIDNTNKIKSIQHLHLIL